MTETDRTPATQAVEWASIEESFAGGGDVGAGGVLLLGNGLSMNIWSAFGYSTLLERSGLDGTARELFGSGAAGRRSAHLRGDRAAPGPEGRDRCLGTR